MQGRSKKNKAGKTNESTSVWWPVWESFKDLLVDKPVFGPADKMQKHFMSLWPFLWLISGILSSHGCWKVNPVLTHHSSNHLLSWSLVFVSSSILSIKTGISAGWEPLISEGYGSICKSKQAVPLLVHLLRDFIYPEDFMSLPSEFL